MGRRLAFSTCYKNVSDPNDLKLRSSLVTSISQRIYAYKQTTALPPSPLSLLRRHPFTWTPPAGHLNHRAPPPRRATSTTGSMLHRLNAALHHPLQKHRTRFRCHSTSLTLFSSLCSSRWRITSSTGGETRSATLLPFTSLLSLKLLLLFPSLPLSFTSLDSSVSILFSHLLHAPPMKRGTLTIRIPTTSSMKITVSSPALPLVYLLRLTLLQQLPNCLLRYP